MSDLLRCPHAPLSPDIRACQFVALAVTAASVVVLAGCSGPAGDGSERPTSAPKSSTRPPRFPRRSRRRRQADAAPAAAALSAPVQAQIDYALKYWQDYNEAEYGVLGDNDCVNFASQSLIARGWQQDDEWFHAGDVYAVERFVAQFHGVPRLARDASRPGDAPSTTPSATR